MDTDELVESIYEAAAVPEFWPQVLQSIGDLAKADAASLMAFDSTASLRYITTQNYEEAIADYAANGAHLPNLRPQRSLERMPNAFVHDLEVCSQEELDADPIYQRFGRPYGLGWTGGTVVPVPSADIIVYDVARKVTNGPFSRADMERLDPFRPHLARAALLAHRLGLKAARATTEALEILGLPAAVIGRNRTVLAANPSVSALSPQVRIGAFDRIHLQSGEADDLLGAALTTSDFKGVRSMPLPATETTPAIIAHVVPIRRSASDIFAQASFLLLFTVVNAPSAPMTEVLTGLFDLTPAEARVARGISKGLSPEEMASSAGLSRETVRGQLKAVMAKTGTRRQAELAVLLSGLRPLGQTTPKR